MPMKNVLERILGREDLSVVEAETAMNEIMSGRATSAQIAGLLIGLAVKGEHRNEIVGFAGAMRAHSMQLSRSFDDCFDTCGTGGDGSGTFNVSSVAAIVLAACGVMVAKHGNRSVSSASGSADLFEALGVNIAGGPSIVERCLTGAGIAFLYAPTFHPAMRHAGATRLELEVRTAFNLLGPLTNPARAKKQIVGVSRPELVALMAGALAELGSECAWVVHGAGGLDEVSTIGVTKVSEVRGGKVSTFDLHPEEFGVARTEICELQVKGVEESVDTVRKVLAGKEGAQRDVVLVNVAAALFVAGSVGSLTAGVDMAREAIDSGRANKTLSRMGMLSQVGENG